MEGKKSFVLYCDIIGLVEKLPDEKAGQLLKIILQYVNDKNPEIEDILLQIAFEPIKQGLKRDLTKWRKFIEKQSLNGSKGGRPEKPKKPKPFLENPKKPMSVSVSVNVSDSVNVIKKEIQASPLDLVFNKFFEYRKEIKKPIKQASLELAKKTLHELSGGNPELAEKIVNRSIANSWQGLFPLDKKQNQNGKQEPSRTIKSDDGTIIHEKDIDFSKLGKRG